MSCVVTVLFEVQPAHWHAFLDAVRTQAATSLSAEAACRQFDVCVPDDDRHVVFLYEIYDDRAAFDAHLATAHFHAFDALVAPWVLRKTVSLWTLSP